MELDTFNKLMASGVKCGTMCHIVTRTPVHGAVKFARGEAEKRPSPFGEITKESDKVTQFGIKDYEALVNRHREGEGLDADFVAQAPKGFVRKSAFHCVSNADGSVMLTFNDVNAQTRGTRLFDGQGVEIVGERLEDYKAHFAPAPRKAYANQGTDKVVAIRNVKLANVVSITVGGVTYR